MSSRFPETLGTARERLVLAVPALALLVIGAGETLVRHDTHAVVRNVAPAVAYAADAPPNDTGEPLAPPGPNTSRDARTPSGRRALRVCADPNNLPFSNAKGEGFENRLAELIARELDADVEYTWWAQRRGFVRSTLRAGSCDLIAGVPTSLELVMATRPYYRSSYVFLYRKDARFRVRSFDDPVLRRLKIGVQFIGDDYANTPPAHALAARGIVDNIVSFSIYGNYAEANPPARIVDAVADGTIDVAIVWGPLAGWFAKESTAPLAIVPVSPQVDVPFLPFVFDISMGVRRDDPGLRQEVEAVLDRRRPAVDSILAEYGVPRVDLARRGRRRAAVHPADPSTGRLP